MPLELEHQAVGEPPLHPDERVEWVREYVREKPMFGPYRYQSMRVHRGDRLVVFEVELGPEIQFSGAHPINGYLGFEYSVGEACDIANEARYGRPEPEEPQDLVKNWFEQLDESRQQKTHRSVSGPDVRIERH